MAVSEQTICFPSDEVVVFVLVARVSRGVNLIERRFIRQCPAQALGGLTEVGLGCF